MILHNSNNVCVTSGGLLLCRCAALKRNKLSKDIISKPCQSKYALKARHSKVNHSPLWRADTRPHSCPKFIMSWCDCRLAVKVTLHPECRPGLRWQPAGRSLEWIWSPSHRNKGTISPSTHKEPEANTVQTSCPIFTAVLFVCIVLGSRAS